MQLLINFQQMRMYYAIMVKEEKLCIQTHIDKEKE